MAAGAGRIRVGIGGWNFAPWHETFYPAGLSKARELAYASRAVTAIEINGTFYRTQSPDTFRKWAVETPDDFVFSLKAHRVTTNRKDLAEAGPSITRFLESGVTELGPKLGPILWQFAPTKKFEPAECEGFLASLPQEADGTRLRHVVEVRHPTFCDAAFVGLLRKYNVPVCYADSAKYPAIADQVGTFAYARLQQAEASVETGYDAAALDRWLIVARTWAGGRDAADLPRLAPPTHLAAERDVFVFFINGAKERAPAGAQALIARLTKSS